MLLFVYKVSDGYYKFYCKFPKQIPDMKIPLHKSNIFAIIFLLFAFSGNIKAQSYSINGIVNSSTLSCSSYGSNKIITIGDGITTSSLRMDNSLDLTLCFSSPIQIIINNNSNIDFSVNNSDLKLPFGSSISFIGNGSIYSGTNSQCSASDRIWVGGSLLATCEGKSGVMSFPELVAQGGYNFVTVTPSSASVCGSGSFSFMATATPLTGSTIKWYTTPTGVTPIATGITYMPTISTTTTYYVEAAYSGYTTPRKAVLATVNPLPAAPTITAGGPTIFCTGGSVTLTSSAGTSYLWSTGATTASISPATAGNYSVQVTNASGCQSTSSVVTTLTVNTLPTTPTLGTIIQPTCAVPTGSVDLIGLPSSGTWTLTRSGTSNATTSGTGTSTTISGLPVGTYTYAVTNETGCTSASANVTISPLVTNTFSGTWSNGTPTSDQNIVFSGNYSSTSDLSGCSCQVVSGDVVINSVHTLTITNEVNISGGSLTFKDKSSLVQINNVTNSGNITYERMTNTTVLNTDYTYWSSPVAPQTLFNLSPKTLEDKYFSYEVTASSEDWKQESPGTTMDAGKGYIIRGPESTSSLPPPPGLYQATFHGVPNNGKVSITGIYADKLYLIGNPYPSAINADTFLNENATVLDGTLYFWTHNTALSPAADISNPGSGLLAYSSDDYASYNITGGVGIAPDITAAANNTGGNNNIPSGKIAAGQGFFGSSKATITGTNEIVFNNDIRVAGTSNNNSQFFKMSNTKSKIANTIEKNRVWLDLTNSQGAFKQTLIGYITGATNEYDSRFDGESFDGNEFVDFYSVNQDRNLVIQGRALPFDENDAVPLGFRTTIDGAFTIKIDQADGLLKNQAVFIEDKLTNTTFDLKSGDYTFTTVAGVFNDRFVLRYTNKTAKTLSTTDFVTQENPVLVSNKNKQLKINSPMETIDKVLVYDIAGKQIYQKTNVNSNELSISNLVSSHQVLLVKTSLQNGKTVTNKIIN